MNHRELALFAFVASIALALAGCDAGAANEGAEAAESALTPDAGAVTSVDVTGAPVDASLGPPDAGVVAKADAIAPWPTGMMIRPSPVVLTEGTSVSLTAAITWSDGRTVDVTGSATWGSSDGAVVSLAAPSGTIGGIKAGTAMVTATDPATKTSANTGVMVVGGGGPRWYEYWLSTVTCECFQKGTVELYSSSDPASMCFAKPIPAGATALPKPNDTYFVEQEIPPYQEYRNWDLTPKMVIRVCLDPSTVPVGAGGTPIATATPTAMLPFLDCDTRCRKSFFEERYGLQTILGSFQWLAIYGGSWPNQVQVGIQYQAAGAMRAVCEVPKMTFSHGQTLSDFEFRKTDDPCMTVGDTQYVSVSTPP